LGETDVYEPLCRDCFQKAMKTQVWFAYFK
jgi:thymidine kinase